MTLPYEPVAKRTASKSVLNIKIQLHFLKVVSDVFVLFCEFCFVFVFYNKMPIHT